VNVPEAKKTREGIGGGLCADSAVLEVFFPPCLAAVLRDEKLDRASQMQALPSANCQRSVPAAHGVRT
jgi:hypothetical protein